jgi:hypothetical protein
MRDPSPVIRLERFGCRHDHSQIERHVDVPCVLRDIPQEAGQAEDVDRGLAVDHAGRLIGRMLGEYELVIHVRPERVEQEAVTSATSDSANAVNPRADFAKGVPA